MHRTLITSVDLRMQKFDVQVVPSGMSVYCAKVPMLGTCVIQAVSEWLGVEGVFSGWEVSRQRVGNAFGVRYEGSTRAFYIEFPYFSGTVQSRRRPKKSATKPATLPCCRLTSQTVFGCQPVLGYPSGPAEADRGCASTPRPKIK